MYSRLKRQLFCVIAISSYIFGSVFVPSAAADTDDFSSLLEKRRTEVQAITKASDFTDIASSDWFYPYIDVLTINGIIKGTTPTTFSPQSTFSLAECCTVISRYLGFDDLAADRRKAMVEKKISGSDKWYVGYLQVMYEAGIISQADVGLVDANGYLVIDSSKAERPIKRYEFADMISRSFELSSNLRAKNAYSEAGGLGHEYISGGVYDIDAAYEYSSVINDFEEIPEASRLNVLKAYYNGIFLGDTNGFFHPNDNLTRAEMAKVIAVITNYSMRKRLENYAVDSYVTDDNMFFTDAVGHRTLKKINADEILSLESNGITISGGDVTYSYCYKAPTGYAIDVYAYATGLDGKNRLTGSCTLANSKASERTGLFSWVGQNGKVLMVLRSLENDGNVEGELEITISGGGISKCDYGAYLPK